MADHFAAFSFVDRITKVEPGVRARAVFDVPADIAGFPSCLVAEAVGQLAAWVAMSKIDFRGRPVAALATETIFHRDVAPGSRLELAVEIESCDDEAVAYGGFARRRRRKDDRAQGLSRPDASGAGLRFARRDARALSPALRRRGAGRALSRRRHSAARRTRQRAGELAREALGSACGTVLRRSFSAAPGVSRHVAARQPDQARHGSRAQNDRRQIRDQARPAPHEQRQGPLVHRSRTGGRACRRDGVDPAGERHGATVRRDRRSQRGHRAARLRCVERCHDRRRVAITGLGLVTPVGNDVAFDVAVRARGKKRRRVDQPVRCLRLSGAHRLRSERIRSARCDRRRKLLKFANRSHGFALAAAEQAFTDAGIRPTYETGERWGCAVGTGMMGVDFAELIAVHKHSAASGELDAARLARRRVGQQPAGVLPQSVDRPACRCSRAGTAFAATRPRCTRRAPRAARRSAPALKLIRRGAVDCVLAGGFDSMISPVGIAGFCLLSALSADNDTPERASRPFDVTRNGFLLGEGAGFLVLEEWESARRRGAHVYAELAGDGNSLSQLSHHRFAAGRRRPDPVDAAGSLRRTVRRPRKSTTSTRMAPRPS